MIVPQKEFEPGILQRYLEKNRKNIDPAIAAIQIARAKGEINSVERYRNHIYTLHALVGQRFDKLVRAGAENNANTRIAALKDVLCNQYGYEGAQENYDNIGNALLPQVIDTRKGLPVAISILYISCGMAQKWVVSGLNFPDHFVIRVDHGGERIIFDPFNTCKIMDAAGLRTLLKKTRGPYAELRADYYQAVDIKDILIRLENNIKFRQIEMEDYEEALKTIEIMQIIDPEEYRLLFDAGVLHAKLGQAKKAISLLESYIDKTPHARDKDDAVKILNQLRLSTH